MIRSCEWHGTQAVEFTKRDYTALLVPSVGANLVRLAHTRLGVEVLRTPSEREHDEFLRRPHVYGVPILFPPNRIADGRFRFDGREYRFPITRPEENNYHHGTLKSPPFAVSTTRTSTPASAAMSRAATWLPVVSCVCRWMGRPTSCLRVETSFLAA